MKQSKRLLLGTAAALYGLMVLYTGASRAFMTRVDDPRAPLRTPPEQLATLRDFNAIDVESDVSLELVQQSDYSIDLIGFAPDRGDLLASVEQGTLLVRGYGNAEGVRVRIGMPQLQRFTAGFAPLLSITGFRGDALSISVQTRPARDQKIELKQNAVTDLELRIPTNSATVAVEVDRASVANGIDIIGAARLILSD